MPLEPIRINNITLGLDDDLSLIKKKVSKKLRVSIEEVKDIKRRTSVLLFF